jgi:hypothetical protein
VAIGPDPLDGKKFGVGDVVGTFGRVDSSHD